MLCSGKAGARIEREQRRSGQQPTRQPLRVCSRLLLAPTCAAAAPFVAVAAWQKQVLGGERGPELRRAYARRRVGFRSAHWRVPREIDQEK